jgi:hypothetical protein
MELRRSVTHFWTIARTAMLRRRAGNVISAGAAIAALGLTCAAPAAADQQFDEQWYLKAMSSELPANSGPQAIQLAYQLCQIDKRGMSIDQIFKNGDIPLSLFHNMLGTAKTAGLCKYVSTDGSMNPNAGEDARRQAEAITGAIIQGGNDATNDAILNSDPDPDNDGIPSSVDGKPRTYNPFQ